MTCTGSHAAAQGVQPRRSYTLPAVDADGRLWDFVVKSWANGSEHRRVFVLEQARPQLGALRRGAC